MDPERSQLIPQPHLLQVFLVCNSQDAVTNLELSVQKKLQKVEELSNDSLVLSKNKIQPEAEFNGKVRNKELLN